LPTKPIRNALRDTAHSQTVRLNLNMRKLLLLFIIFTACQPQKDKAFDKTITTKPLILSESELEGKSSEELRIIRNEIFARKGYRFKSTDLQDYFSKIDWYEPKYDNVDSLLSETNKRNIELLLKFEKTLMNSVDWRKTLIGIWIKKDYVDSLPITNSTLAINRIHMGISEMHISKDEAYKDSIYIGAGFNNHEGAGFWIFPTNNKSKFSSKLDMSYRDSTNVKFEIKIHGTDTLISAIETNFTEGTTSEDLYTKVTRNVEDSESDGGYGIEMITNRWIGGDYILIDKNGKEIFSTVTLTQDGRIIGFKDFKEYFVATDFIAYPINTDAILLRKSDYRDYKNYGFEKVGNDILLYSLKEDTVDYFEQRDKLIYKLIKK